MPGTVITGARVFDGERVSGPATIVIDDGLIAGQRESRPDDTVVDAAGAMLLPGLIDAHVHVDKREHLESAARFGVTTMLDMGSKDLDVLRVLQHLPGLPTLKSAGHPANGPDSMFVTRMGMPAKSSVAGPDDAARFVAERVAEGSDFIKILVEEPKMPGAKPLSTATIAALVTAAHDAGRITVAHIVSVTSLRSALDARVDIVTHTALGAELDDAGRALVAENGTVIIPTLTMMQAVITAIGSGLLIRAIGLVVPAARMKYRYADATVRAFRQAGSTVLLGTDANDDRTAPAQVPHGESAHEELGRLVDAGLTPLQALQGATSKTADVFGLTDRGRIRPGLRADLLLVDGDPTVAISATRSIRAVWIGGAAVPVPRSA